MSENPRLTLSSRYIEDIKLLNNIGIVKRFKKGEILFKEHKKMTHIMIVIEGIVELSKKNNQKDKEVRYISSFQIIGETLPEMNQRYPLSASFLTNGIAVLVEYDTFRQLLLWSPKTSLNMFKLLNRSQEQLFKKIEKEKTYNSIQRVASFLLEQATHLNQLQYKEMASIIDITPETFSRQLKKLREEQYIHIEEGDMILNHKKLQSLF